MKLWARTTVESMKEYHPPLGEREGLRLDFNENVSGCSQKVLDCLRAVTAETLNKYPERHSGEIVAAAHFGVETERLLLTNGVDEAIHLLCETYLEPDDEVLIVVPTFSMYEIYALATGATVITIPANEDFSFPLVALLKAINYKTRMICIANPNNPTGAAVECEDLLMILRSAPQAAVLVDEAYYDFNGETLLGELKNFENLFVTRTFSKAYGLAGFRLGALMGDVAQMQMVRRVGSPYNVNGVALECLKAALADKAFVANYCAEVKSGREQLEAFYKERGIRCWPSRGNFVLAYFGEHHAAISRELRRRGILVRDRSTDPGCNGCVRITLGSMEQTLRLLHELPEALTAIGYWNQSTTEAR